ncbi:MAG: [FeFe] hydrogenase H-cluster radical SAM maturase HydE [Selenomonadaceae bacterium]|nr:[FeFe] hydrogenase H-cluster radical SAM maturase HydE [Selenomonadaceae bacterium]
MQNIVDELYIAENLSDDELMYLIQTNEYDELLFTKAERRRKEIYGTDVYIRGLIEFTNYCKNDCYYCGIRRSNKNASRYRMSAEEILSTCEDGYRLGFRTFVLQGGEDPYFTDERVCEIVSKIREKFSDCAITLSIGEKSRASYQAFFDAGANRYLLRHETASEAHYKRLHPEEMKLSNRKRCLFDLKEIGYQVGAGFMVGSPFQRPENIVSDLRFLQELKPDMIGIGPFISHSETPFGQGEYENGSLSLTLRLISILRLMFPYALIPATTALATIDSKGRELGIKAGANVVMPNLTPEKDKGKYLLYDNKICLTEESALCREITDSKINSIGYNVVVSVGNPKRKLTTENKE